MSIFDYFLGSEEEKRERAEKERIENLGQTVPEDITYESPETPIDKQEREVLFPKGIPREQNRGALAELAASSQQAEQRVDAPSERPVKTGASAGDTIGGAGAGSPSSRVWYTTNKEAIEKARTEAKEAQGYGKIGFGVGTVVRLAASMGAGAGAGAAAGGAGGAGAGGMGAAGAGGAAGSAGAAPAAGTAAGASSAAGGTAGASTAGSVSTTGGGGSSFGGDFMSAFKGQGGGSNGYGSMLGRLARKSLQNQMQGGGGSGGSSSGVSANQYGGPEFSGMAGEPDALTAESKGKQNQAFHSWLNMIGGGADADKQYARMVLENQTDELVPGRIPWG